MRDTVGCMEATASIGRLLRRIQSRRRRNSFFGPRRAAGDDDSGNRGWSNREIVSKMFNGINEKRAHGSWIGEAEAWMQSEDGKKTAEWRTDGIPAWHHGWPGHESLFLPGRTDEHILTAGKMTGHRQRRVPPFTVAGNLWSGQERLPTGSTARGRKNGPMCSSGSCHGINFLVFFVLWGWAKHWEPICRVHLGPFSRTDIVHDWPFASARTGQVN